MAKEKDVWEGPFGILKARFIMALLMTPGGLLLIQAAKKFSELLVPNLHFKTVTEMVLYFKMPLILCTAAWLLSVVFLGAWSLFLDRK